jgi:CheY-like chemotaxis protein
MAVVRLVCPDPERADRFARQLRASGHEVSLAPPDGGVALREIRADPPDAVVLDLSSRPAHGRDLAIAIRAARSTRQVALVIVDGDPEKIAAVRRILPDATYTPARRVRSALRAALRNPPVEPVVPSSNLAGYSGTPLPRKLGIKPGTNVVLIGAPEGFETTLGDLPHGVVLRRGNRGARDLTIWFVRNRAELRRGLDRVRDRLGDGHLWIAWPKKTSPLASDVGQPDVRRDGLASGLVDYKVCAIDATWSGLKFAIRSK